MAEQNIEVQSKFGKKLGVALAVVFVLLGLAAVGLHFAINNSNGTNNQSANDTNAPAEPVPAPPVATPPTPEQKSLD